MAKNISRTKYESVTIPNASVKLLNSVPYTCIVSPGIGKFVQVLGGVLLLQYGGTGYTETADNLQFKYKDASGTVASNVIETTGFLNLTEDAAIVFNGTPSDTVIKGIYLTEKAVVLCNVGDAEFGGGHADSLLIVKIAYRIITTGF